MSNILTELEKDFIVVLRAVGPDLANAAMAVLKSVLNGDTKESIESQAEKATTLALYKAAYHRAK